MGKCQVKDHLVKMQSLAFFILSDLAHKFSGILTHKFAIPAVGSYDLPTYTFALFGEDITLKYESLQHNATEVDFLCKPRNSPGTAEQAMISSSCCWLGQSPQNTSGHLVLLNHCSDQMVS